VPNRTPNEDEGFDSFHGNNSSSSDGENDESKTNRKQNETARKEQLGFAAKDVNDSTASRFVVTEEKAAVRKEGEVKEGQGTRVQLIESETTHQIVDFQGNLTANRFDDHKESPKNCLTNLIWVKEKYINLDKTLKKYFKEFQKYFLNYVT